MKYEDHYGSGGATAAGHCAVRELADLTITKIVVGPMDNNAYLLRCKATGQQLLIDAAAEPGTLLQRAGTDGLTAVVTTHRHSDHWQALRAVVVATGARTYAGRYDAEGIPGPTDIAVDDGDNIRFGRVEITAHHLKGHTPGSITLLYRDPHGHPHLFTGDCLFPGGVGNTGNDPHAFTSLLHDLETKIFNRLPDTTWVYPGHGADTTLGTERPHLEEWRARGW
ncbi:MBL fold metallo-hydrolase [Streptomyces sp. NPDC001635]